MNENLDLTKILEGCPVGTKLYSSIFGELSFVATHNCYDKYPIELQAYNKSTHSMVEVNYAEDGRSTCIFDGECTLFPSKDQRDWSKFERFWDKPKKERFDPKTLQPFDKILVRNSSRNSWVCDLFSHIKINIKTNKPCLPCFYPIVGLNQTSEYCVPYNEETKYLIGTTNDCPEYYKWWEE